MSGEAAQHSESTEQQPQGDGQPANAQREPVVDYGEVLRIQQEQLAKTGKTVEDLRAELGQSKDTLGKIRQVFVPEESERLTPYQRRMQSYQDLGNFLQKEALENQKAGGAGLPITTKIGQQLVELGLESEKRAEALERELADIKKSIKRQENPAFQGLERAAFIMEGMVDEGLEQLYGADANSKSIRAAQFNAVTARINAEIKDLMKNDPDALLKVQRNPKIMRNMVNHFMAEMLPPKVREMLDNERIQNEEQSPQELYQAFAEAREKYEEAQAKGDAKQEHYYSTLMTEIRHDILGAQIAGRRKGGGGENPTLNQIMGGVYGAAGGRS